MIKDTSSQTLSKIIAENEIILMEAAVVERLRRSPNVNLHPTLVNAPLIYDSDGRKMMANIHNSYIDIAQKNDHPIFLCTPTWRANYQRVFESTLPPQINIDAVSYLKELRDERGNFAPKIKIGGLIGCKNDCYKPEEGLAIGEAEIFHTWQIDQLVKGGVDFLIAETLPLVDEAIGIAKALEKSNVPYFISFVISKEGFVLDGTSLEEAIRRLDESTKIPPLGFLANCAHPTFLNAEKQPSAIYQRLIGFNANASALEHNELDHAEKLHVDDIPSWGKEMLTFNQEYGLKMLGGCCGTGIEHLTYLTKNI